MWGVGWRGKSPPTAVCGPSCSCLRATGVPEEVSVAGVKVDEKEALQQRGIKPSEVASIVSEAFNEMIFSFG